MLCHTGLCKSKWERKGQISSGNYEYIDVNINGSRYIIEISLASQYEIARPSETFTSLLHLFPPIFVGKVEELVQIGEIMCKAIKLTLKNKEMHVPPWRRIGYVKAKWISSYRRTVNEVPEKRSSSGQVSTKKSSSLGFSPSTVTSLDYCRQNFVSKAGFRVGHLAMAINEIS